MDCGFATMEMRARRTSLCDEVMRHIGDLGSHVLLDGMTPNYEPVVQARRLDGAVDNVLLRDAHRVAVSLLQAIADGADECNNSLRDLVSIGDE